MLEDRVLVTRGQDMLRSGRGRYRIVEPLITFYEAIMRRHWSELERHRAGAVWDSTRHAFPAQVVGPHFEALCREFAANEPRRILSLGKARRSGARRWAAITYRLAGARDLLARKGYDTRTTALACSGGAGFTRELRSAAAGDGRIALLGLDRLYRMSQVPHTG